MNWALAIERNREALLRIVAMLFAMTGMAGETGVVTLPRHLRSRVLRILRPAESAVRRLIVIAARDVEVVLPPAGGRGATPQRAVLPGQTARQASGNAPGLPLVDPRKRFDFRPRRRRPKSFPRICVIGVTEPRPIPDDWFPSPDDEMNAAPIRRRLTALKHALNDLDGCARRLARLEARRAAGLLRARRYSPMRPGRPPGHRKRPFHEVDAVLRECHALALTLERAGSP